MNQSAAKRALIMLESLTGRPEGVSLSEICETLALPKSIGHRLLALLVEAGYVVQHSETARYGLTLKLTMLGLRHYASTGLDDLAQPVLDRLAAETGELARLAVVEGDRLIWVAKAQGARSGLRYDPELDHDTGHDVVLHATATGKAWLATLPEDVALRIVEATRLQTPTRFGPNAARSLDDVRRMLHSTRSAGFGEAVEEGEPGTAAVAVAVIDSSRAGPGVTVATLSLAGPMLRFGADRRPLLAARLIRAAQELGGIWPLRNRLGVAAGASATSPESDPSRQEDRRHERQRISAV